MSLKFAEKYGLGVHERVVDRNPDHSGIKAHFHYFDWLLGDLTIYARVDNNMTRQTKRRHRRSRG